MHFRLLSLFPLVLLSTASMHEQIPILSPEPDYVPLTSSQPTLYDLLTIESSASIFFSYARELELSDLLVNQKQKNTLLVPTNKAVMALARKPHQGPAVEPNIEISDQEFDEQSKRNTEQWVSAHIIPVSPISFAAQSYDTLLDGKSVSFFLVEGDSSASEWTRAVINGDMHIIDMKEGLNGVLYLIDGTVKLD